MLRCSFRAAHQLRDKAANAHNFAFDTVTRVYRDAVYASDAPSRAATAPETAAGPGARRQRHSGVQLEVLQLFRDLMRETRRMEDVGTRKGLEAYIREEFRKNALIPRRCITQIEWQMHYGKNKLEELRNMRSDTKFSVMR